jgi:hypothetical protein
VPDVDDDDFDDLMKEDETPAPQVPFSFNSQVP